MGPLGGVGGFADGGWGTTAESLWLRPQAFEWSTGKDEVATRCPGGEAWAEQCECQGRNRSCYKSPWRCLSEDQSGLRGWHQCTDARIQGLDEFTEEGVGREKTTKNGGSRDIPKSTRQDERAEPARGPVGVGGR